MAFLFLGLMGSVALNLLLFVAVGLAGLGSADEEGRVQERYLLRATNRYGRDKVAILSIEGTILSGEGFFKQQIDHARKDIEDGNLKAIVLRVNSPGGTISGSDYMLHHLRKLVKEKHIPIVVSMGAVAASGGYYVSMCVGDTPDSIFAEPSTWTGSIGVLIPHYNFADLMEKWGIQEDDVASNPLKDHGQHRPQDDPRGTEDLPGAGRRRLHAVQERRQGGPPQVPSAIPAALDKLATGQVFTADQALENGLIDKIGFIEDAIDRAIQLARLEQGQCESGEVQGGAAAVGVVVWPEPRPAVVRSGRVAGSHYPPRLLPLHLAAGPGCQREVRERDERTTAVEPLSSSHPVFAYIAGTVSFVTALKFARPG